jgi:thiol-disulfide isomerase/thioredoxin
MGTPIAVANDGFVDLADQPATIDTPAVVNFWATWCAPCIKELPDLEELGEKLGDEATVYLVNFGESSDTIEQFRADNPALFGTHTVLLKDPNMAGLSTYGLRGVPTTVLIDQNGESVESIQGIKAWGADAVVDDVRAKIAQ